MSARARDAASRLAAGLDTRLGSWALVALGIGIRVYLARGGAFTFDVTTFRGWSDRLVERGPADFYAPDQFADYPPGYLYVLWALGEGWRAVTGHGPGIAALKLPAIAADVGLAFVVLRLARQLAPDRLPRALRTHLRPIALGVVMLNPAVIMVSAVWGQVDSLLALLVLGSLLTLTGAGSGLARETGAVALLSLAIATKPQAVFALPAFALVLAHRHLRRPRTRASLLAACRRAGALALVAGTLLTALFAPFRITPDELPSFFREIGSVYELTSLWAFNTWGVVGFYRPDIGPDAVDLLGVPAFHAGLVAFAVAATTVAWSAWRALARAVSECEVALFTTVAVAGVGFALLTRGHERYLYLTVVALTPFVARPRFRWVVVVLTALHLLNLHFAYVWFSERSGGSAWTVGPLYDAVFGTATDAWQRKVLSAATAAACLAISAVGWRWLEGRHARSPRPA